MRTAHVDENGNPKYTNRLVDEASPYLVQHAHNPVNWFPWGAEAFDKARSEDKPVFLSIGYSTCHWCHVMERESFDDEAIAEFLNDHFVSIKLDREQRPDLDDVYMTGVQMLTGQGGWPMSSFLTHDGEPFFAGTYFPPDHFRSLLEQISQVWKERRDEVSKQAREIARNIARFTSARAESTQLGDNLIGMTASEILGRLDETNGGFGGAPKFPNEVMLSVLLDDVERSGNTEAMRAVSLTLDKMYQGGINDQVAGGFHRYTVDAVWLVPHFEKMLYNQAQLLRLYSHAARLTGDVEWRRVATTIVDYLLRDMTDEDGTFFSATDADSEGEEGKFFVWTPAEIDAALDPDDAETARSLYQVTSAGNFEGANILNPGRRLLDFAAERDLEPDQFFERLDQINARLYQFREEREHPVRDEKVITGWNGMMITALAFAGQDLGQPDWISAAERAAETLWSRAQQGGSLWRISVAGASSIPGNLEDYAFLAETLLVLHAVTGNTRYRDRGAELVSEMIERFWDAEGGGFYLSLDSDEGPMITRPKSPMDGATASANSAALHALVLLWRQTGSVETEQRIVAFINAFAGLIASSPSAFSYMNLAIEDYRSGQSGVVQFAGGGNVRVRLEGRQLVLDIADGWHINANALEDPDLIPTSVDAANASVRYPENSGVVWAGEVGIDIQGDADTAVLTLQPCSGELCMAPERLTFRLRA